MRDETKGGRFCCVKGGSMAAALERMRDETKGGRFCCVKGGSMAAAL